MESVSSNYVSPRVGQHHRVTHPIADRIIRSLHHRIRLLHRSTAATFHVLGATGNVYTVNLAPNPTCTCPDRTTPCKHILFVLIRALGVSPCNPCLRRRRLHPCHLDCLLSAPARPDCLASPALRDLFHQLSFLAANESPSSSRGKAVINETVDSSLSSSRGKTVVIQTEVESPSSSRGKTVVIQTEVESPSSSRGKMVINHTEDETASCPICLEEIILKGHGEERERAVEACRVCKNVVHKACMVTWKRSRGRRLASCVICRARWRWWDRRHSRVDGGDSFRNYHDKYLNLSAYIDNGENAQMVEDYGSSSRHCGD